MVSLRQKYSELQGNEGAVSLTNLIGQTLFMDKVYEKGHHEFVPKVKDGLYIVTYVTGKIRVSKKLIFLNR